MANIKIGNIHVSAGLQSATVDGDCGYHSVNSPAVGRAVCALIQEIERLRARPPVEVTVTPEALDCLAIGYPPVTSTPLLQESQATVAELFGILESCIVAVGG